MVEIINNLYDAFVNAKVKEIIKPIIDELFEYTVYHFTTEEKMFEEKNYPLMRKASTLYYKLNPHYSRKNEVHCVDA